MGALVRFFLIFICTKLTLSKPQHLQEQQEQQHHLDPLDEPQFEYTTKDQGKRTIGPVRHYAFGKHIGIHPFGYKYVLGYSPINVKYVPVIKPVTVFKPILQQSLRYPWKPIGQPVRQYLPQVVSLPRPVHHVDHGWKPVIHQHKPWSDEHLQPVLEQAAVPEPEPAPAPVTPIIHVGAQPILPVKPHVHNYFYYQTPISKPLFHVTRPQLPVLPLGATFPVPVLPAQNAHSYPVPVQPPVHHQFVIPAHLHPAHLPPTPVHPAHVQPVHVQPAPLPPAPLHPEHLPPAFPPPIHLNPIPFQPEHAQPPAHPQQVFFPTFPRPQQGTLPPISVEFHGNHNLLPNAPVQPQVIVGRPFRPVDNNNFHHQAQEPPRPPFNPDAAIQPGQTDLQVPEHLPQHPQFRHVYQLGEESFGQFPAFQSHDDIARPSISLEPPYTRAQN